MEQKENVELENNELGQKQDKKVENINNKNKNTSKKKNTNKIYLILILLVVVLLAAFYLYYNNKNKDDSNKTKNGKTEYRSEYRMKGNSIENFDLYFLKLENEKENKVYSPLSIKYALGMLAEGSRGDSKEQITSIIGDYKIKSYTNSKNMSFANAMFIGNAYKDSINKDFTDTLSSKYNAEIVFDDFKSAENINSWVKNKTLGLIDSLLDQISSDTPFELINALGIDMDWEEKFIRIPGADYFYTYAHEKFSVKATGDIVSKTFEGLNKNIAGMEIAASINNYDIVKTLGEDKIRKIVGDEYKKYLLDPENAYDAEYILGGDTSSENLEKKINEYLDSYIESINKNYKKTGKSTSFSLYTDDNIKVFSKDLKEYDGITLEYVAIMPQKESLDSYIKNIDSDKLNEVINSLKELKPENFKDGVVTKITGFIPRFKFEYKLNLKSDLESLGIKDVFDSNKSDLTGISSDKSFVIGNATHKANIEFTQDGIKAAAASSAGGLGAGGGFDYSFDVPVEEIDLTFDKPYMFIIMDKNTKEVWFAGTVYEPLTWSKNLTYSVYYN